MGDMKETRANGDGTTDAKKRALAKEKEEKEKQMPTEAGNMELTKKCWLMLLKSSQYHKQTSRALQPLFGELKRTLSPGDTR